MKPFEALNPTQSAFRYTLHPPSSKATVGTMLPAYLPFKCLCQAMELFLSHQFFSDCNLSLVFFLLQILPGSLNVMDRFFLWWQVSLAPAIASFTLYLKPDCFYFCPDFVPLCEKEKKNVECRHLLGNEYVMI